VHEATDHRLPFQTGSSALPSRSGRLRFDSANPDGALNPAQEVVYFSKFRTDYYYLFVYTNNDVRAPTRVAALGGWLGAGNGCAPRTGRCRGSLRHRTRAAGDEGRRRAEEDGLRARAIGAGGINREF
jgi:hypothetical protein